jgi:cytochrome c oxidase subunit 2
MNMGSMTAGSKPDILIIGHQWWWEVHYLGDSGHQVITANEIHIPAHRPVNIELRTADVIHSFWVPSLHGKVDLLPGNVNFIRIEASEPGNYVGQCAEYCGKQHANMHILLIAQEAPAFAEWLANQGKPGVEPTNPDTVMGHEAFLAGPCSQCHTVRGTPAAGRIGPDLTHVGSRKEIGSDTFTNNNAYLEGWITNAQALKPGCKMPKIPNTMERSFARSSPICVSFNDNNLEFAGLYPQAETDEGRLHCLDAESFRHEITSRELTTWPCSLSSNFTTSV